MRLLDEAAEDRVCRRWTDPAFAAVWRALQDTATEALRLKLVVPDEGAGWGHDYFCPDHATRLEYDPAQPRAHRCPVDGRIFAGGIYDAAWRARTNHEIVTGLRAAALLWRGGGDVGYLEHAAGVLDAYAAHYPRYEVHGTHAGQGRCMGQSLDEATWAIPLAWSYDLLRDALSASQRESIEGQLLRPAAEHLLGQLWRRIHNIECWHLAALVTLGVVLEEDRFIAPALDEQYGYVAQLREGVLDDGWWWEGSPTYHFYTLSAVLALISALRRPWPALVRQPRLRAMFDAPFSLLRGDLSLPATNDGWFDAAQPGFLARHAGSYEIAQALWEDPRHDALLARLYATTARDSVEALLFGADRLATGALSASDCVVQEASGYAVLRDGKGENERYLLLKYGPHGGGHGHCDKLALDLHAFGQRLSADLGTPGYGIPLNKSWYRHTLSHNTVLIDETAQPAAAGELIAFSATGGDGYAVADARVTWPDEQAAPYSGVVARRCVLWKGGVRPYFIDIVQVHCPEPRRIDLAWHHDGELDLAGLAPLSWNTDQEGYIHLSEAQYLNAVRWQGRWRLDRYGTACWALNPAGTTTIAARVPANPAAETRSLVLRRTTAAEAVYVAVFEPFIGHSAIRAVHWIDHDLAKSRLSFVVESESGRDAWIVARAPQPAATPTQDFGGATVHHYLMGEANAQ